MWVVRGWLESVYEWGSIGAILVVTTAAHGGGQRRRSIGEENGRRELKWLKLGFKKFEVR